MSSGRVNEEAGQSRVVQARADQVQHDVRVLQIVEATLTGVGKHCLELCGELAQRGCSVDLIYSPVRLDRGVTKLLDQLRLDGMVNLVECPMQRSVGPWDWKAVQFVRKYIKRNGPFDVVHGHSSKGGAVARLATVGTGVPSVYTPNAIRTMNPQVSGLGRVLVGQVERLLSRIPGKIVAVSPEEAQHIVQLGVAPSKLVEIPNGITPKTLPSLSDARQALGLREDWLVAGFVGRLSEQKALDVLMKALPKIVNAVPNFRLAMIGDGELGEELKALSRKLGVDGSILWLGQQPGFDSMPAFDVFVLPSRYEGMPYVLIEALMAGLPVVTTDLASSSMLVKSGVNGFVVPAESPEHFADALLKVLTDEDCRNEFSRNAALRASRFTLSSMVDQVIDLYKDLIRETRTARQGGTQA